jgi:hypothetical protein
LMIDPPDPILEEIHATRRQLLKEHGSVAGLAAFLREEEAKSRRTIGEPSSPSKPNIKSVNPSSDSGVI